MFDDPAGVGSWFGVHDAAHDLEIVKSGMKSAKRNGKHKK
jgi:hypothetical protein